MTLNAKDFNVVGDGEHDDTPELIALRDHIRAGPGTVWPVEFPGTATTPTTAGAATALARTRMWSDGHD